MDRNYRNTLQNAVTRFRQWRRRNEPIYLSDEVRAELARLAAALRVAVTDVQTALDEPSVDELLDGSDG